MQVELDDSNTASGEAIDLVLEETSTESPNSLQELRELSNNEKDELLKLSQVLNPLRREGEFQAKDKMKSYVAGTREWAMDLFDDWLQLENEKKHKVLVLSGMAGLGKTTIASKVLTQRCHIVIAHHFCLHDNFQYRDPRKMMFSLSYQMAEKIPEYRKALFSLINEKGLTHDRLLGREFNQLTIFHQLLKVPLYAIPEPTGQYVILIDAVDECKDDGKSSILDFIQVHFLNLPSWLRLFVTTRPEVPIMEKLVKFKPKLIEATKHVGNLQDLYLFFKKTLPSKEEYDGANDIIGKLTDKSEGLFLNATLLAETIRGETSGNVTMEILDKLPSGIHEFYEEQIPRIFDNPNWGESLEWKFIGLIVAAVEPLHFKVLQCITESTENEVKSAIGSLSRFFPQGSDQKLRIYHKSLADWLVRGDNKTEFRVDIKNQQTIFANQCWNLLNTCMIPGSTDIKQCQLHKYDDAVIEFILQHGVTHLCLAGRKEEARKLVLDVGWLMTRSGRLENCYNLVFDFQKLSKDDKVVELIGRAVGLSMNALRMDYRQLPGQLIGRLGGGVNWDQS